MAIELPNGQISRTLPEQVGFNSEKIAEIIKAINDFELVDKVIDLDSASGVLTDTQFGIAELSPSFILYSGKVFIKAYEDGTNIDFIEVGALVGGSTTLTLSVERFRITVSTKAYQYDIVQLFESYTKAQIDSLLSAGLALKANLAGANFTGAITAPSIIETMSGYSFTPNSSLAANGITLNYVGVVKTGNKITFVVAGVFKHDTGITIQSNPNIGRFTVPAEVSAKLIPNSLGNLDDKSILFLSSATNGISKYARISDSLQLQFYKLDETFALDTSYEFRYEATFLLSDSLI